MDGFGLGKRYEVFLKSKRVGKFSDLGSGSQSLQRLK